MRVSAVGAQSVRGDQRCRPQAFFPSRDRGPDVLIVGEVDTGLLRGRDPTAGGDGRDLVALVLGEQVLVSTRPRGYVRSPERPVGVDCSLGGKRQTRGIGTALQRAAVTDREVVQGSAYATLVNASSTARRPWSHYLARPGVIEAIGRTAWPDLAEALAAADRVPATLDLGAVARRATDQVQSAARPGGADTLRAARSRLRWVARVEKDGPALAGVHFDVVDRRLRLLRFTTSHDRAAGLAAACEDIALHDWLLSTLIESVHKAAIGLETRAETLKRLLPAIDRLLHLWMPAARADDLTEQFWTVLERRAGFTRQWTTLVDRVRDQLSVGVAAALSAAIRE